MLEGLGCVSALLGLLISMVWGGWVLSVTWGWFIVPIFGLPPLSVPQAMAMSLLVGWLTKAYVPLVRNEDIWFSMATDIALSFFTPAVVLVISWVLLRFI